MQSASSNVQLEFTSQRRHDNKIRLYSNLIFENFLDRKS
jgi:hypothetical protein